jgi:hypothetical protein
MKDSCGFMLQLSGLWHQTQRRGQPLKKTVVLMPGPSCKEQRCMLNMNPFIATPLLGYARKFALSQLPHGQLAMQESESISRNMVFNKASCL